MLILTIRTDKPEAEIGLLEDAVSIEYKKWQAHRELSETLLSQIESLLARHQKNWKGLDGIVCFKGPGSFTGLRIGLTVANTLADQLDIPIVGSGDVGWIEAGLMQLREHQSDKLVIPDYGAPVHITQQKK